MEIMASSNLGSSNPLQHPIEAASHAIGSMGGDPRMMQKSSFFQAANEGPAEIASKISGVKTGGKRVDDGPYFTNNEGIPWPDPYVESLLCHNCSH